MAVMHTVELMERALILAEQLGYEVRHEWLGGTGGGGCEVAGRKYLFVDLALNSIEQFDQVIETLRNDISLPLTSTPAELQHYLERAA
jgi:hypothetical protein